MYPWSLLVTPLQGHCTAPAPPPPAKEPTLGTVNGRFRLVMTIVEDFRPSKLPRGLESFQLLPTRVCIRLRALQLFQLVPVEQQYHTGRKSGGSVDFFLALGVWGFELLKEAPN